jgi:hypothetical protein
MMKNALFVTASIIVGASGVQLLHAQSKAPAYFLGAINVKDQDGYRILPSRFRNPFRAEVSIGRAKNPDVFAHPGIPTKSTCLCAFGLAN